MKVSIIFGKIINKKIYIFHQTRPSQDLISIFFVINVLQTDLTSSCIGDGEEKLRGAITIVACSRATG